MGLRESRIINEVHPWFGGRLRWLGQVARLYGGVQLLISGNRTREEQAVLYKNRGTRPVALPGCSQHQYGYAADAVWQRFAVVTSKGKAAFYTQAETDRTMNELAAIAGLTTVSGDPGHLQVFNGVAFRTWAVTNGFCSDRAATNMSSYQDCLAGVRTRSTFNTPLRDILTKQCYAAWAAKDLARASQEQGFKVTGSLNF